MTLQNFKKIEQILPPEDFVRIHRSYIIALDKIKSVEKNRIRIGDELLPVSDTYRDAFYAILERKGIV